MNKPEIATLFEMLNYIMGKTNIGKSNYDSTAITCLNRLFLVLGKDKRKFNITTGKRTN